VSPIFFGARWTSLETRHAGQAPLWRNLASRLLNQTAILVGRAVSEALAVVGTHRYQLAALAALDAFGAVSQAELCRRTNIDRSDMNAVVNALEAEGIVTRVSDPDDRRQNIVEMTETGKARFERLKAGLAEAEDRALAPLPPADRRELLRLLRILHDLRDVNCTQSSASGRASMIGTTSAGSCVARRMPITYECSRSWPT